MLSPASFILVTALMTPKIKTSNGGSRAAVLETNAPIPNASAFSTPTASGDISRAISIPSASSVRARPPNSNAKANTPAKPAPIYSSTIGVEINHIYAPERRRWIFEHMESASQGFEVTEEVQQRILDLLIRADIFEQVMQQRYLGTKRFSLEGVTALIPFVDEVLDTAAQHGAIELVMGMSHRGRLNVMAHVAKRSRRKSSPDSKTSIRAASSAPAT